MRSELIHEDLRVLNLERNGNVDVHHDVVQGRAVLHGRVVRAGLPRDDVRDPIPSGPEGDEPRRQEYEVFVPLLIEYEDTGRNAVPKLEERGPVRVAEENTTASVQSGHKPAR